MEEDNCKETTISFDAIITQLCQEGLCQRPQLLTALWDATKKIILANSAQGKNTLLANCFYSWVQKEPHKYWFCLQPTDTAMRECSLRSASQTQDNLATLERTGVVTEISLFHSLAPPEKEYFRNDKDLLLRLFYILVTKMKEIMAIYKRLELVVDGFGVVRVWEGDFVFVPAILHDKMSPNLKYKRFQKTHSHDLDKSQESKYSAKGGDSIIENRSASNLKKRPYFHQLVVENEPSNTKIINDLLGAGIDPLTFNVNYSKLANSSSQLLSKEFTKQPYAQGRLPCVIDKFSRTKGSQLTSIKVSNSIVVRIGSNYSPAVKNYYLDIKTKQIELIVPEAKIKLEGRTKGVLPASQQEEYQSLVGKTQGKPPSKQLEGRVALRRQLYNRYIQYIQHIIPNDSVSPLDKAVIERIVTQVKTLVKKIGRKDGSPLINALMTEANNQYYLAYKKAVLDYILRDRDQLVRTGITIPFERVREWGSGAGSVVKCPCTLSSLVQSRNQLQLNHMLFPECLTRIYLQNEKLSSFQLFKRRKEGEYRPYSILYYIKRNINQLNQTFAHLCENWVGLIAGIIEEQLKGQPISKMRQFFNSIHILMSNKLKELVYTAIGDIVLEFLPFGLAPNQEKQLLIINISQNNHSVCFIDDIEKVFRYDLLEIVAKIVETTRRVPRVEHFIKNTNDLFIWGVEEGDEFVRKAELQLRQIVEENYQQINKLKEGLKEFQNIFAMVEKVGGWCRSELKVDTLTQIFKEIHHYEERINGIKCYYTVNMVVVDCLELKKKLTLHLKNLKKLIHDTVDEQLKRRNSSILTRIRSSIQSICRDVKTTSQLVDLYTAIEQIKQGEMPSIREEIQKNVKDTLTMFTIEGFTAAVEVMRSMYLCRRNFQELTLEIYRNEKRLYEERVELEKRLREKINNFQTSTFSSLKDINSKIDSFDMRKLHSEYLATLGEFQEKVEKNKVTQRVLNAEEEDLKWTASVFPQAKELENIVEPNFELWKIVAEYDSLMKEWKYIELSHFDIETAESKMTVMDNKITKLISKLKNFAGLKIIYELQNDVKEFLGQQVSIIKIFSNPGLKERHWSLFNKRLPLSGYDLKELTYGRIKLLYDYEKNLKVLMSISNQAAKEFQIENQKQAMQDYWNKLSFELEHLNDENIIFVSGDFLDHQTQLIQYHLTKTVLLKNSPFSKALGTMLLEWENWLLHGKKILVGFRSSQEKFKVVRSMFKMDEINKLLPIESTEYDSIQNIWKSVVKKILDQPRVTEFFKSQKMPQIIEEIGRKADFVRSSFQSYLTLKRLEFPRLYFLTESAVLHLISLLATDQPSRALNTLARLCFTGIRECLRLDSGYLLFKSHCDQLQVKCDSLHSRKSKSKFFEQLVVVEKNMRENISIEIKLMNFDDFIKKIEQNTLTSLMAGLQLQLSSQIKTNNVKSFLQRFMKLKSEIISKLKEESSSIKLEYLVTKLNFLEERVISAISSGNKLNPQEILMLEYTTDQLQVTLMGQNIPFNYQYLGDEVVTFIPTSSDQLLWHLAHTLTQNNMALSLHPSLTATAKLIGYFTAQYCPQIFCPSYSLPQNYQACLMGTVSTNYWVFFDHQYLQLSFDMLAKLTHLCKLKKQKIQRGESILNFRNNELNINPTTLVFLVTTPEKVVSIPKGILTCTRSLALFAPQANLISKYVGDFETRQRLKKYLHILKVSCSALNIGMILQKMKLANSPQESVEIVKIHIWRLISLQQQNQFLSIFYESSEQRQEPQFKTLSQYIDYKAGELAKGLQWSNLAFVVGEQTYKSKVINHFLTSKQIRLFNQNRGINLSFIEEGVSELDYFGYLEKAREKAKEGEDSPIYLYIDSDLSQQQLQLLRLFIHTHSIRPEQTSPLKIIVETQQLNNLEPSILGQNSIVHVKEQHCEDKSFFKERVNELTVPSNDKVTIYELEHSFESLISFVLKMEKRPFSEGRAVLARRFFIFFEIFLTNLNGKEAERMCELEKESYIFNSFAYCAFWALGICSLRDIQIETLKKYINETFGQRLDLPTDIDQIYLTEDNEWAYWQTLKQEFSGDKDSIPFYQVWVPTANNTKLLTLMVRLVERNNSMILWGNQSGRSSLLNEISCFELTYNPFFIDCHKKTSTHHISALTRGKVLFGQNKSNLILVDDLHLPSPQICGIFRTFIERGYCPILLPGGNLNEQIGQPAVIATWKSSQADQRCFNRLLGRCLPIQLQKFEEKQLQFIFKTYLLCFLPPKESQLSYAKTETSILNFFTHSLKVFPSLEPKHIKLLIESVCKNNSNQEESCILQHLLIQSDSILGRTLPLHQQNHFFRHMGHYYSKFLNVQLKNQNELQELSSQYLFDIREQREAEKKENMEERTEWIQKIISSKDSTNSLFVSQHHTQILQRLFWTLKGNNSHVIILSQPNNGCKTLAKMAGWLLNLNSSDFTNVSVSNLVEEVVKVLKTGGKVDECVNILGHEAMDSQSDLMKLVHSLMFSPEFHECFGQILMEQIIKSFNSEKKFLKKNVKKAELIKKIRQKFNSIYHFCLCISKTNYDLLLESYPKFSCIRVVEAREWPSEALFTISKHFLQEKQEEIFGLLIKIDQEIRNKWDFSCKPKSSTFLVVLSTYERVSKLLQARIIGNDNSQMWSKRVKMNQQKLENLENEKKIYESQHVQHFNSVGHLAQAVTELNLRLQPLREVQQKLKWEFQQLTQQCNTLKLELQFIQHAIHEQYEAFIQSNRYSFLEQFDNYLASPVFGFITANYGFQIDKKNTNQIIQLLYCFEQDYFHKLEEHYREDYQQLGTIWTLISTFRERMKGHLDKVNTLSSTFKELSSKEDQLREQVYKIREIQDKISDLKDEEEELKQNMKDPSMKRYEEICKKIQQYEAITSILLKYQYVLRSKNDTVCPIPSCIIGPAVLVTYFIIFSSLLQQNQLQSFETMLLTILSKNNYKTSSEELKAFFTQEEQFTLTYNNLATTQEWVNLLAMQSNEMSMVMLGQREDVQDWIERYTSRHCCWLKSQQELKDMLQMDQIIIIDKPLRKSLQKLSYLMIQPTHLTNNAKNIRVQDEQIAVHQNAKIVFVFQSIESVEEVLLLNQLFVLKVFTHASRELGLVLEDQLRRDKMVTNRGELVKLILKGHEEMSAIDEKMHSIITKMRKQNVVSEIIFKRIEEQGEHKLATSKTIEGHKKQLQSIGNTISSYQHILSQLQVIYDKSKEVMSLRTFLKIFGIILEKTDIKYIYKVKKQLEDIIQELSQPWNQVPEADKKKINKTLSKLLLTKIAIIFVPDLSLALQWLQLMLDREGQTMSRVSAQSSIAQFKEKDVNVVQVSRNQEVRELCELFESNVDKIRNYKIVIVTLEYVNIPAKLDSFCLKLIIKNINLTLFLEVEHQKGKELEKSDFNLPYQEIMDRRWLQKQKQIGKQEKFFEKWLDLS